MVMLTLARFSARPDLFSSSALPDAGAGSGSDHVSHTPGVERSVCPPRGGGGGVVVGVGGGVVVVVGGACLVPDLWAVPPLKLQDVGLVQPKCVVESNHYQSETEAI